MHQMESIVQFSQQETGISAGTFLEKDRTNIHAAEIQHYVPSPLSEEEPETIKQLQTGYMLSDLRQEPLHFSKYCDY